MKKRYIDPFTPDLPINSPDRFSGRKDEINSVVDSLFQLVNNQPKHTIITGDRGIGKSSVLTQVKNMAEGDMDLLQRLNIDAGVDKFDFVCAWHDCSTDQNPAILASGILRQLENKFKNIFNGLTLELNIAGILKIGQNTSSVATISEIVEQFCASLTTISSKVK